jgi:hypothetical protein
MAAEGASSRKLLMTAGSCIRSPGARNCRVHPPAPDLNVTGPLDISFDVNGSIPKCGKGLGLRRF